MCYRLSGMVLAAAVVCYSSPSPAVTVNWAVQSGDWSVPTNWDPKTLPTSAVEVWVRNGGTVNVTTTGNTCWILYVGGTGGGTVQMVSGELIETDVCYLGRGGLGGFRQSGGTHTARLLHVTSYSGNGTYELSGTGVLAAQDEIVGGDRTPALFTQSGGTNMVSGSLTVADGGSGIGTYNISGGLLSAPTLYLGRNYAGGTFIQSGGTVSISGVLTLSDSNHVGDSSTYTLSGGQLTAMEEWVANASSGTFTQTGGTNTASRLRGGSARGGTYNLNGGLLTVSSIDFVGGDRFNFNGGTLRASGTFSSSLIGTFGASGGAIIDTAGNTVTLSGPLSGPGGLNKLGGNTLTLTGANTYTGDTRIEGGILSISNPYLNDLASVYIATSAKLDLNFRSIDTIALLYLDGALAPAGTWGVTGSGAAHIDNIHFSGTGQLNVVPEPSTFLLLGTGVLGLLGWLWRRRA